MKSVVLYLPLLMLVGASVVGARNGAHRAPSSAVGSVSFAKAITLKSPVLYPYSIAAGDLDHDGFPDLAVVGIEAPALLHALGKGNGHVGPWSHDGGSGYAPSFVTFADLDLDGNLDALTNDATQRQVVISFGNGHGHFPQVKALDSGVGYATNYLAVDDLNGDGVPDIVGTALSIGEDFGEIFVRLGKGRREFQKAIHFPSGGYQPSIIAVADLNHDNIPDLVVVNYGKQPPYGTVSVLLGKGDGTFAKPVAYGMERYQDPIAVTLGDFDGDGTVDMAVSTVYSKGTVYSTTVHVFLGKGDGTFSPPKSFFASSGGAYWSAAADFNGDGMLDLAVESCINIPQPCYVSVLLGNGDGSLQAPVKFHVGFVPGQIVAADFNGDSKPDIAMVGYDGNRMEGVIGVLLNTTPFPVRRRP